MTRYRPGDVVLVSFPFTDLSSTKRRPAVILNPPALATRQGDVVVLALTSQPQRDSTLALGEWAAAGLPKPIWLKPVIGTIVTRLVVRRLGRLHPTDLPLVDRALRQLIHVTFLK